MPDASDYELVKSPDELSPPPRSVGVWIVVAIFMGVAAIKFKNGDMEAMGKNLGGAVALFLVPKIIEVIMAWAAQ